MWRLWKTKSSRAISSLYCSCLQCLKSFCSYREVLNVWIVCRFRFHFFYASHLYISLSHSGKHMGKINCILFPQLLTAAHVVFPIGNQQDDPRQVEFLQGPIERFGVRLSLFPPGEQKSGLPCSSPMCLTCCPTALPFTSEVTRRLLSQWPPLNSSLPSCETTKRLAVTSTPGANGPDRKRWVLEGRKEEAVERGRSQTENDHRLRGYSEVTLLVSLGVGHCGVLDEGEVVGDVLVVRQPAVGPDQAVLADCHLRIASIMRKYSFWNVPWCQRWRLTIVSGLPCVMKEWDWFLGTTALTSGTLSLMPCHIFTKGEFHHPFNPKTRRLCNAYGCQTNNSN